MKLWRIAPAAILLAATAAYGQSTAAPVLPGSISTSGCQAGYTSCYLPYSNSNPLPVTTSGGGTASSVKITDGTNGPAAVKPASTAPTSADPALVVAISPNGQNANGSNTAANSAPIVSAYQTTIYTANVTNSAAAANASATVLRPSFAYNGNTAVCYLQFWNLASGSVTVGTTAPLFSIGIPANSGGPLNVNYKFSTALTVAATTTRAGGSACTNGIDLNLFQD